MAHIWGPDPVLAQILRNIWFSSFPVSQWGPVGLGDVFSVEEPKPPAAAQASHYRGWNSSLCFWSRRLTKGNPSFQANCTIREKQTFGKGLC